MISCARYVGKLFWPDALAVYYPHPGAWPILLVALAGVFVVAATLGALIWTNPARADHRLAVVPRDTAAGDRDNPGGEPGDADRYSYIPSIGIFLLLVWTAADMAACAPQVKKVFAAASVLMILALSARTFVQCGYWRDSETLFRHTLQVTRNNAFAHLSLAKGYLTRGRCPEGSSTWKKPWKSSLITRKHAASSRTRCLPKEKLARPSVSMRLRSKMTPP